MKKLVWTGTRYVTLVGKDSGPPYVWSTYRGEYTFHELQQIFKTVDMIWPRLHNVGVTITMHQIGDYCTAVAIAAKEI